MYEELGFKEDYLVYLKDFMFIGIIWCMCEGEFVFYNELILCVEVLLIEV